ncbi:hypothetical protein LIER_31723 [Lithospermum erythrorhizon]|uniref:Uncharacterized protein n=1 Tax=Lithospermum erythrorhizon TaxID=34254 RepID=A0AAV3RU75_LITER
MNGRESRANVIREGILHKEPILMPSAWACLPQLPMVQHVPGLRAFVEMNQNTVYKCGGWQTESIIDELTENRNIPLLHRVSFVGGGVDYGPIDRLSS